MAVVLPVVADTVEVSKEAELLAAEVEWASADPRSVVGPLTIIAEVCIIRTRAPDRCVLLFSDHPP